MVYISDVGTVNMLQIFLLITSLLSEIYNNGLRKMLNWQLLLKLVIMVLFAGSVAGM